LPQHHVVQIREQENDTNRSCDRRQLRKKMTQDDTNDTEQGSGFDPLSTTVDNVSLLDLAADLLVFTATGARSALGRVPCGRA
jgi:hypothetical protein